MLREQITLSNIAKIFPLAIQIQISFISMYVPSLVKIPLTVTEVIVRKQKYRRVSVNIWWNLPISNPKPDLHTINAHTKFGENPLMFYSSYHPETKIWACLGQVTPSKFDENCPLAIPNQISTISMHIPMKIHWCLLKLSSGNEIRTDVRVTYGQTRTSNVKL